MRIAPLLEASTVVTSMHHTIVQTVHGFTDSYLSKKLDQITDEMGIDVHSAYDRISNPRNVAFLEKFKRAFFNGLAKKLADDMGIFEFQFVFDKAHIGSDIGGYWSDELGRMAVNLAYVDSNSLFLRMLVDHISGDNQSHFINEYVPTIMHEYGHVLQARAMVKNQYYEYRDKRGGVTKAMGDDPLRTNIKHYSSYIGAHEEIDSFASAMVAELVQKHSRSYDLKISKDQFMSIMRELQDGLTGSFGFFHTLDQHMNELGDGSMSKAEAFEIRKRFAKKIAFKLKKYVSNDQENHIPRNMRNMIKWAMEKGKSVSYIVRSICDDASFDGDKPYDPYFADQIADALVTMGAMAEATPQKVAIIDKIHRYYTDRYYKQAA